MEARFGEEYARYRKDVADGSESGTVGHGAQRLSGYRRGSLAARRRMRPVSDPPPSFAVAGARGCFTLDVRAGRAF